MMNLKKPKGNLRYLYKTVVCFAGVLVYLIFRLKEPHSPGYTLFAIPFAIYGFLMLLYYLESRQDDDGDSSI